MYRKSSRFNLALILGAFALATMLLGSCVASTPVPTATATLPVVIRDNCGPPIPPNLEIARDAAIRYITLHFPEQNVPSVDQWEPKSSSLQKDRVNLTLGDWGMGGTSNG
jgi:hypothetical protein